MRRALIAAILGLLVFTGDAGAQDEVIPEAPTENAETPAEDAPPPLAEPPPPIYEDQLLRLSEILGALSFLRTLCGESDGDAWREEMRTLLAAEHPGPQRRARLTGRFNHGFETFNALYRSCTPSARLSIGHYLAEGAKLSNEVRSRYSQ
jgi:uncharacterized protein (TIGR02301 family)